MKHYLVLYSTHLYVSPLQSNLKFFKGSWKDDSAALAALPKDLGSVPNTHMVVHNHS